MAEQLWKGRFSKAVDSRVNDFNSSIAGNDAGWMKLPCESVKTHEREDVTADYLISGQFLDSFARSLMDRPNRLMKPAESA